MIRSPSVCSQNIPVQGILQVDHQLFVEFQITHRYIKFGVRYAALIPAKDNQFGVISQVNRMNKLNNFSIFEQFAHLLYLCAEKSTRLSLRE